MASVLLALAFVGSSVTARCGDAKALRDVVEEHISLAPPGLRALSAPPGIHHLFALGTNVFSGSSPAGEAGFAALAKLGVKTIITVDGATPDVLAARKYGMRYVHLPHGYDGIGANLQLRLAKAGEALPGPFYVHCHHGRHRGPAAAAVFCMAREGWSPAQAGAWLKAAGTATNYSGLYDAVRNFRKPGPELLKTISPEFPEITTVPGLVDSMVEIDERWENLKAVRAGGYRVPKAHPDLTPANEIVILWEHYREAGRGPDAVARGADFVERLKSAEAEARLAEKQLRLFAVEENPDVRLQLDRSFEAMARTCSACHKTYRDPGFSRPSGITEGGRE
jgi:hypothetical protein